MRATYSRIKDEEETKKGLIILKAVYGKTVEGKLILFSGRTRYILYISLTGADNDDDESETIDVTVPLQCLVRDSKLVLHEQSKVCII